MLFTFYHYVESSKIKTYFTTVLVLGFSAWLLKSVGNVWLFLSGVLLGVVFHYFSFGFAGFWRNAFLDRKTLGMRSHLDLSPKFKTMTLMRFPINVLVKQFRTHHVYNFHIQ